MPKILIASRDEAIDILDAPEYNKKVTAIVSISDHTRSAPKPVIKSQEKKDKIILVLHFDDMEKEMVGNPRCRGWEPPQRKHVMAIIEHAKQMLDSGGWILCHCNAGISRSSATAFILKSIELGPGNEKQALIETLKIKSMIAPNEWMVELADEILGKEWDLSGALKQIRHLRSQIGYSEIESLDSILEKYPNVQIIGKGQIMRI